MTFLGGKEMQPSAKYALKSTAQQEVELEEELSNYLFYSYKNKLYLVNNRTYQSKSYGAICQLETS